MIFRVGVRFFVIEWCARGTVAVDTRQSLSDVMSRRNLLQAAGISGLPMAVPGMVAAGVDEKAGLGKGAAEKSCIFILLCGGPSHLDTWDLKPGAPDTIRGPYKPIATTVPGMPINELHTIDDACRKHQQPL